MAQSPQYRREFEAYFRRERRIRIASLIFGYPWLFAVLLICLAFGINKITGSGSIGVIEGAFSILGGMGAFALFFIFANRFPHPWIYILNGIPTGLFYGLAFHVCSGRQYPIISVAVAIIGAFMGVFLGRIYLRSIDTISRLDKLFDTPLGGDRMNDKEP